MEEGGNVTILETVEMVIERAAISTYNAFSLVLFIAGIVLTVIGVIKKWYKIENDPEITLPEKSTGSVVFLNVGTIIFLIFSVITMGIAVLVV